MNSDWGANDANKIVQEGLGIVSDLLVEGVSEWTDSSVQDDDDWEVIDRLRAENDFAEACLHAVASEEDRLASLWFTLPDNVVNIPLPVKAAFDASRLAIVAQLVKAAAGAVESLIISWDDEGRSEVPSLVAGQEALEAWLQRHAKGEKE